MRSICSGPQVHYINKEVIFMGCMALFCFQNIFWYLEKWSLTGGGRLRKMVAQGGSAVFHSLYCACIPCEHTDSSCKEVQFLHLVPTLLLAHYFQTQTLLFKSAKIPHV